MVEGRAGRERKKRGEANICPRERCLVKGRIDHDPVHFWVDGPDELFPVTLRCRIDNAVHVFFGERERHFR